LDKSITLGSVEPLYSSLLSHRKNSFRLIAKNSSHRLSLKPRLGLG
jgi:hypothetical protein